VPGTRSDGQGERQDSCDGDLRLSLALEERVPESMEEGGGNEDEGGTGREASARVERRGCSSEPKGDARASGPVGYGRARTTTRSVHSACETMERRAIDDQRGDR
jgi:hypothetical protein